MGDRLLDGVLRVLVAMGRRPPSSARGLRLAAASPQDWAGQKIESPVGRPEGVTWTLQTNLLLYGQTISPRAARVDAHKTAELRAGAPSQGDGREVRIINNADVQSVLSMRMCIERLDSAFQEMAVQEAVGMGRIDLYVPSRQEQAPYYRWAVMAGASKKDGYACARMLSDMVSWPQEHGQVRENKFAREPGTFCGLLFLFSAADGTPVAMINDGVLQHVRVGGGAGLGTKYLSRSDSETVGMIGSGGMARTYLDAFCEVRDIKKVKVYSPNPTHVQAYADEMEARHGIDVEPAASAREAVRGVDIVSCCTSTNEPVFSNDWLEPGMHVTNLTSAEVEPGLPVDVAIRAGEATPRLEKLPAAASNARAGYLAYIAGDDDERAQVPRLDLADDVIYMPTLVDLIQGSTPGRESEDQTTFFLNVGAIGAQFESIASAVYESTVEQGLGQEIPTEWFLQDVRD